MKKIIILFIIAFNFATFNLLAASVAISEVPKNAINFADTYFTDYYLYRAVENSGSYTLIFKGGLKIHVNSRGEWITISGGGDEINIEYLEKEVIDSIKKEYGNEKVIYIKKQKNAYKIKFKNRNNITVDFEGNIKKGRRDYWLNRINFENITDIINSF